jgi:hypothetical protein
MLDDNIIGLQLESGQDAVVDAAAEHGGEPDGGEGELPGEPRSRQHAGPAMS